MCCVSDCNQEQLLKQDGLSERLLHLLSACVKGQAKALKTSILTLLFTISQSHHGRTVIIQCFDMHRSVCAGLAFGVGQEGGCGGRGVKGGRRRCGGCLVQDY